MSDRTSTSSEKTHSETGGRSAPPLPALPGLDREVLSLLGNQTTGRLLRGSFGIVQPKLRISPPGDAYEREADRVADAVLRGPAGPARISAISSTVQRRCAKCQGACHCQEEEKLLQPKRDGSQPVSITPAPPGLQRKIRVDRPGERIPNPTGNGVVQTNAEAVEGYLRRLTPDGGVRVDRNSGEASMRTGYCPGVLGGMIQGARFGYRIGNLIGSAGGHIPLLGPIFGLAGGILGGLIGAVAGLFGAQSPSPAAASGTPTGSTCVCDFVHSSRVLTIQLNDEGTPSGSATLVKVPSPNSRRIWGNASVTGQLMETEPWLILGHEMCGHSYLARRGGDEEGPPEQEAPIVGRHPQTGELEIQEGDPGARRQPRAGQFLRHGRTVDRENLIRAEQGIAARGYRLRDPYCGESFWRERGDPQRTTHWQPAQGVENTTYLQVCEHLRSQLPENRTGRYRINERIPEEEPSAGPARPVQRKATSPDLGGIAPSFESQVSALRGRGEPLSPATRSFFEPRFGCDFGGVRVHTGTAARDAARAVHARAFTVGNDIVFGAGEYSPRTSSGRHLLAHELTHTVQQRGAVRLQRSPLSDSVRAAWTAEPKLEALLARLSQADVQGDQSDSDIDAELARLLKGRADDLWVAQRVRQGELGKTTGRLGPKVKGKLVPRPVKAFFFRGATPQRALVIAGVHGTERQGIQVAEMLIDDLKKTQPHYTAIVVPSMFPDNAARGEFGIREEKDGTPTNRNFPPPSEDLAAARAAGSGTAVDASTEGGKRKRAILPENLMLMELMERFRPERIISIHGTHREGAAGVFYDRRSLRADEVQAARQWAAGQAYMRIPPDQQEMPGGQEQLRNLEEQLFQQRLAQLNQQATDKDRDLSKNAATQIDTATAKISGREGRSFANREDDPKDPKNPKLKQVPAPQVKARKAHPSVAGNVGPTGALDRFTWSGSGTGGASLGEYAPPRGMSVFTVEPPINRNTGDYPTPLDKITAAERRVELQEYANAVRTVLLGA